MLLGQFGRGIGLEVGLGVFWNREDPVGVSMGGTGVQVGRTHVAVGLGLEVGVGVGVAVGTGVFVAVGVAVG